MPLGGPELLIILVIVLIIFGAGKLPQVFGSLGKGVREFREASEGRSDTGTIAGDGAQQAGSPSSAASTAATPLNAVSDEARGPHAVSDAPQPGPTSRREES